MVHRGDDEFDTARRGWNRLHSTRPAVVVFCRETQDVVNALTWAREHALPVRVRSGRHGLEGWSSVDDGVVIDVSDMTSVEIDAEARTATVGAGLTQTEAVTALGDAGFAAPTGTEGTVGLAGATLGGGFGLLTRAFGMACDNLLSAEVVVASPDGGARVLTAGPHHHEDLLWALRGAGNGTLGVVTAMTYRIHPMPQPVSVTATWRGLGHLAELMETWQGWAPYADSGLTSQLEIHRDEVLLFAVLTSGTPADALTALTPVLSIGSPEVSTTSETWAATYAALQVPEEHEPASWKFTSQFVYRPFPSEAIEVVRSFMSEAPTADSNYFVNAFGGAVRTSEPPGGAAFAHRDCLFYAEPGAGWGVRGEETPAGLTETCLRWVASFSEALQPYVDGAYVNVPNPGMDGWADAYWGDHVGRLRQVKARYDPDGVFDAEHGLSG